MPFRTSSGAVLFAFILCLWGSGPSLSGQGQITAYPGGNPPNSNAKHYTITGTVFNSVTNEPIRRALVRLQGQKQDAAFTGADGRFEFADVPEGQVSLSAERPGFFDPVNGRAMGGGRFFGGPGSSFTVSSSSNDFRLPLMPEAKLTGTVLDRDGEPIPNLPVELITAQIVQGRKRWVTGMGGMTDESGVYRFDGQAPGPVIVATRSSFGNGRNTETYAPRFYPDSPDRAGAQTLNLGAGQEEHADFTLTAMAGFSISGTVRGGPAGNGNGGLAFWVNSVGMQANMGFVQFSRQTGKFTIRMIPSGSWNFHFQMQGPDNKVYETDREITVANANVTGVDLTLEPGVDIPLHVNAPAAEGSSSQSNNGFAQVRLQPADDSNQQEVYASGENETGQMSLVFRNVHAGRYTPVFGAGAGCLGAFTYGSADVTTQPLVVNSGEPAQTLTVNLRKDCATLDVTLHADNQAASGEVILVPESNVVDAQVLGGSANTTLTAQSVTPGTYHVYAVPKSEGLEYTNPEAMRGFPSQEITLEPGQKASVTLDLPASGHS